jgi:hypothetical protein
MRIMVTGLIGMLALSAGCGAARSPQAEPAPAEAATTQRDRTRVEVDNQNFNDMNIYLLKAGDTRVYLGSASGLTKTTLLIPRENVGGNWEVRLFADPVGPATPIRTGALLVAPKQSVYWTIGPDEEASTVSAG